MKFSLFLAFSACLFLSTSPARADVSETLDSYRYQSEPEIELLINTAAPMLRNRNCRGQFRSYLKKTKTKFKAFAYTAKPNGGWQFCKSTMQKTQALADRKAVEICNKLKNRTHKLPKCKLFASHHTLLFSKDYGGVKPKPNDLFYALEKLSMSSIKKLVESGADIKQINKDGYTPMLLALRLGRVDAMEYLLSKGANINHKDKLGYDALNFAAKRDSFKLFEYVLSRGADIHTTTTHTKLKPIHHAAQTKYGELRIIELILKNDGDINARDRSQRTALHHASKSRRYTPLKFLIKNGADINAKNISGDTPLDVAGDGRIRKYIIKHGGKSGTEN